MCLFCEQHCQEFPILLRHDQRASLNPAGVNVLLHGLNDAGNAFLYSYTLSKHVVNILFVNCYYKFLQIILFVWLLFNCMSYKLVHVFKYLIFKQYLMNWYNEICVIVCDV